MPRSAFRINGAGCGLADLIQAPADFHSPRLRPYQSRIPGDGGLEMGRVIPLGDFLRFSGRPWEEFMADVAGPAADAAVGGPADSGGAASDGFNVGGPALAALTLASQLLRPSGIPVSYYGLTGDDALGARIRHRLAQTPLDLANYRQRPGRTPRTWVFSDPRAGDGHGDRFFIYDEGMAGACDESLADESFFQATFNLYAGTAQFPALHAVSPKLLEKGRRRGAFGVVGTVFDSAAERTAPGRPWTLGGEDAWPYIDLLVGNGREIGRLAGRNAGESGQAAVEGAADELLRRGLAAVVVTQGPGPVYFRSLGGIFGECRGWVPAHAGLVEMARDRRGHPGDTVGAGDNFLGGLLTHFLAQILADDFYPKAEVHLDRELFHMSPLRLRKAIEFAVVAGGLACLQYGGVRLESGKGESLARIREILPEVKAAGRPW